MKNIILTLILSVLTINGYSQNAYDITNDSPIAIRASSVQHLTYFDDTGKLSLNEVIERTNDFKENKVKTKLSFNGKVEDVVLPYKSIYAVANVDFINSFCWVKVFQLGFILTLSNMMVKINLLYIHILYCQWRMNKLR